MSLADGPLLHAMIVAHHDQVLERAFRFGSFVSIPNPRALDADLARGGRAAQTRHERRRWAGAVAFPWRLPEWRQKRPCCALPCC
jgi:hypothetical protein